MKNLTACTAVLAALIAVSSATAQNRIQVVPQLIPPPTQPQASYFLGVYTSTVQLPGSGPVGPVAAIAPRVMPLPGPVQPSFGQRVNNVVPGSPAAQIGLEPGDILVTGNNIPLTCKGELLRAISQSGGQLRLTVINVRTGQPAYLTAFPQYQGGPLAMVQR